MSNNKTLSLAKSGTSLYVDDRILIILNGQRKTDRSVWIRNTIYSGALFSNYVNVGEYFPLKYIDTFQKRGRNTLFYLILHYGIKDIKIDKRFINFKLNYKTGNNAFDDYSGFRMSVNKYNLAILKKYCVQG